MKKLDKILEKNESKRADNFTEKVINVIRAIPAGRVISYGVVAYCAGNKRGARQVSRILHSCSEKYNLPWHRVLNFQGKISLKGDGFVLQKSLLLAEGILFIGNSVKDFSSKKVDYLDMKLILDMN